VVFTSLDGDLSDFPTHTCDAAKHTIESIEASGVSLVAVTEKSFAEVETLARDLGLRHALIFEGGAGLAFFESGEWRVECYGPDADAMLDIIRNVELAAGADLSVYSVLPPREASRITGLSGEALARSQDRRSDEPFVITRGKGESVAAAARKLGFSLRRDGRGVLYHLYDPRHLKRALERVREELPCRTIAGIGFAGTDLRFLSLCDRAIVVPREDGVDPEILKRVPGASVAPSSGISGWVAAVHEILNQPVSGKDRPGIAGAHSLKRQSRRTVTTQKRAVWPQGLANGD